MIARLLAFLIIALTLPLFLIITIIIYFDDRVPIIFKQKRFGKDNNYFWIYKFRTMKSDTKDIPTHLVKSSDIKYTSTGQVLRKYSFDELPQLFNILKGDMNFIGPRPALHNQVDLIDLRTKSGIQKLLPGVTGWAQVNGRDELSIEEKVLLDEYYLKNRSIFLSLKILFLTLGKVIKAEGIKS